jgi:PAS domain S-box-containing protein
MSASSSSSLPTAPLSPPHANLLALRERAEAHRGRLVPPALPASPEAAERLLQELQLHKLELEVQCQELLLAQAEAAAAHARYVDLYEQAPVGYFSLSPAGLIEQLNSRASQLLGGVRHQLAGRRFGLFVAPAQRLAFGRFLARVLAAGAAQNIELPLLRQDGSPFYGHLEGLSVATPAGPQCRLAVLDVSARHQATEALAAREARLSLALKASQTGVFTWELATGLVEGDATAQAVYGQVPTPGPQRLSAFKKAIHPADFGRVWGGVQAALAVQEPLALEYRVVWPDGSVHYAALAGRVVANAQGHATGFAGVLREVTSQRAADEELHYKSLVLERMLNKMPMVLSRLTPAGDFLEMTGAGLQAVGMARNALVGQNVHEVYPEVRPELAQVLRGGQAEFLAEIPVDGHPVAFQNYAFFDEQGQQAVVLAVDVTAPEQHKRQLQAEKEFSQSLLENSVDCIISLDHQGRITVWNAEATHYFGVSAADAQGRLLTEVLPTLGPESYAELARAMGGQRIDRFSRPFETRAGRYDAHLVPLPSQSVGQPGGVLIILRDVTERDRQAEEATRLRLRQQQEVLAAILNTQETERKRIAEALHNGLGQLLYATKLSLDGRGGVPPAPRDSLRLLEEAIRTTRTISFELTPGILEDFGLHTALEALVKRLAPARLPVHLHLRNLDQRLPAPVEIAVYRAVQELLNNVMKHARATEVEVHVAYEEGRLHVSVEDNGCGFEPAALATEPLAGIGLAGVRNRVALLGGELQVRSRLGRGTIISFEVEV